MDESMDGVSNRALGHNLLGDPELRRLIERVARRRMPESEVDDVVQTVLVDALAADTLPDDPQQLRRWIVGITRHKVADYHRRGARGRHVELPADLEAGESEARSAREWVSWAEKQAAGSPEEQRTLEWMAREGAGEKLAHIASEEQLPAAQIRQRVSRLRRMMKQRWVAEMAAVAAVVIAILVLRQLLQEPTPTADPIPLPDRTVAPPDTVAPELERARALRADAVRECDRQAWQVCLDKLDEARRLDPAGDTSKEVSTLRERAKRALETREKDSKVDPPPVQSTKPAPAPAPPAPAPLTPSPPDKRPTKLGPKETPTGKKGGKPLSDPPPSGTEEPTKDDFATDITTK
jgi:DNA-directed RNA polymerase specialized sigma24 family protein